MDWTTDKRDWNHDGHDVATASFNHRGGGVHTATVVIYLCLKEHERERLTDALSGVEGSSVELAWQLPDHTVRLAQTMQNRCRQHRTAAYSIHAPLGIHPTLPHILRSFFRMWCSLFTWNKWWYYVLLDRNTRDDIAQVNADVLSSMGLYILSVHVNASFDHLFLRKCADMHHLLLFNTIVKHAAVICFVNVSLCERVLTPDERPPCSGSGIVVFSRAWAENYRLFNSYFYPLKTHWYTGWQWVTDHILAGLLDQ